MVEGKSISFHGSDGCGKSTLAWAFNDLIAERRGPCVVIGGSSYRSWLTKDIASDFGCNVGLLDAPKLAPEQKTTLYEDIAAACYGLARRIAGTGTSVIIDSDPYVKRMIWASLEHDPQAYREYISQFEAKMYSRIGGTLPEHLVQVSLGDEAGNAQQVYERILARGKVSEYDPDDLDQAEQIVLASENVWSMVISGERFRRAGSRTHQVVNRTCPPEALPAQTVAIAGELYAEIFEL